MVHFDAPVVPMFSCNPMCYLLHNCSLLSVWDSQYFFRCCTEGETRPEHFSCCRWVLLFGYFSFFISLPSSNSPQVPAWEGVTFKSVQGRCTPPRFVSCTCRWAGDICQFQEIRYFLRDADGKLLGISFCESSLISLLLTIVFPKKWNCKVGKEHACCLKVPSLRQFYFSKPVLIFPPF